MKESETATAQIRAVISDLEAIRFRLESIQAALPLSPAETSEEDFDSDRDPASEMHAVLGCCLRDRLDPLIRDLATLAV